MNSIASCECDALHNAIEVIDIDLCNSSHDAIECFWMNSIASCDVLHNAMKWIASYDALHNAIECLWMNSIALCDALHNVIEFMIDIAWIHFVQFIARCYWIFLNKCNSIVRCIPQCATHYSVFAITERNYKCSYHRSIFNIQNYLIIIYISLLSIIDLSRLCALSHFPLSWTRNVVRSASFDVLFAYRPVLNSLKCLVTTLDHECSGFL